VAGTSNVGVHLSAITKRFGSTVAVDGAELVIEPGEFFSLLGPSGCGKTTLLRIVAGFEKPEAGSVRIGTYDVTDWDPRRRPTAMVFQSYALFPNMTVGQNVEYGLRVRRVPKEARRARVVEALERVDMSAYSERPVTALSGGQQQRVALARAMAPEPSVLLFDEPLSNLDVALRERTRHELRTLQQRMGMTSVYVTHDQEEALALSDRMAVMKDGRILQVGSPKEVYDQPTSAFVASFLGRANIIDDPALQRRLAGSVGDGARTLAVRPEHIVQDEAGVEVVVTSSHFLGAASEVWIDADGTQLRASWRASVDIGARVKVCATEHRWVAADTRELS
jgi:ABC-type Fe3+/spermidine/putrescine transport system ATPase subunit